MRNTGQEFGLGKQIMSGIYLDKIKKQIMFLGLKVVSMRS